MGLESYYDDIIHYSLTLNILKKKAYYLIITKTIAPNAIDHRDERMKALDSEEDQCIDKIIASQAAFFAEFEAYAKGDWTKAAKGEMTAVQKALEAIK
ncbi:hypothetical protein [Staphylococcus ratti]|uniref:Uncharacterized protein n=1 Tax=Staphylococcus ratti TaxID=2892440 RepID=A0ABY3PDG0_9STAP|nr:hypothetical protein [Staphylococcus ratti]UEX90274.1 hypothetical protein LN051_00960 [Staphylococcus ratti]